MHSHSLDNRIKYRIFDDLLIGNFAKTTLYGVSSLYEGGNSTIMQQNSATMA